MFRVGQKVVCIKGGNITHNGFVPVTGGIYTVRGFFRGQYDGSPRIWLEEYIHPEKIDGIEIGWNATRFRPIVERKTDISIFTEILRRESAPSSLSLVEAESLSKAEGHIGQELASDPERRVNGNTIGDEG